MAKIREDTDFKILKKTQHQNKCFFLFDITIGYKYLPGVNPLMNFRHTKTDNFKFQNQALPSHRRLVIILKLKKTL